MAHASFCSPEFDPAHLSFRVLDHAFSYLYREHGLSVALYLAGCLPTVQTFYESRQNRTYFIAIEEVLLHRKCNTVAQRQKAIESYDYRAVLLIERCLQQVRTAIEFFSHSGSSGQSPINDSRPYAMLKHFEELIVL